MLNITVNIVIPEIDLIPEINLPVQELELAVVWQLALNFLGRSAPMVTAQTKSNF